MIFTAFEIWITVKNIIKTHSFQNSEYFFYFFIASKFSILLARLIHTSMYNVCWKILSCRYCSPMGRKNILSILLCSRPWRSWVVGVLCREPQLIRLEWVSRNAFCLLPYTRLRTLLLYLIKITNYGRPVKKLPSLHGRKLTKNDLVKSIVAKRNYTQDKSNDDVLLKVQEVHIQNNILSEFHNDKHFQIVSKTIKD